MPRVEEYLRDGEWLVGREHALVISTTTVLQLALKYAAPVITPQYVIATAKHESTFAINERDTEASGFRSWGIYQISEEEAVSCNMQDVDMLDEDKATLVLANLASHRLDHIMLQASTAHRASLPFVVEDVPAYLALAHNEGLGACLLSIKRWGLDWRGERGWVARNQKTLPGMCIYGSDCLLK